MLRTRSRKGEPERTQRRERLEPEVRARVASKSDNGCKVSRNIRWYQTGNLFRI